MKKHTTRHYYIVDYLCSKFRYLMLGCSANHKVLDLGDFTRFTMYGAYADIQKLENDWDKIKFEQLTELEKRIYHT